MSITFFWRSNSIFSNWYPVSFSDEKNTYDNMEQYMMYHKAVLFDDEKIALEIMNNSNPKIIKKLGRNVRNFNNEIWDKYKIEIVERGLYLKFSQNENLKKALLDTNSIIAEASPYDKIWGIGMAKSHPDSTNLSKWKGQNLLGKCLMNVREKIKNDK